MMANSTDIALIAYVIERVVKIQNQNLVMLIIVATTHANTAMQVLPPKITDIVEYVSAIFAVK